MASATTLNTTMPIQQKRTGKSQQEQHKEDIYKMRYKQQPVQDSSAWAYPQQQAYPADWSLYQQHYAAAANGSYYYVPSYYQYYPNAQQQPFAYPQQPHRPSSRARTPPMSVQKSSSTPIPSSRPRNAHHRNSTMPKQPQQQRRRNHDERKSPMPRNSSSTPSPFLVNDARPSRPSSSSSSTTSSVTGASSDFSSGRRSSVTSVSSNVSIRSEMSVSSKLSLSKRLRKVFSVSSLRSGKGQDSVGSLYEANGSNTSLSTFDDSSSVVSNATTSTTASRSKSFRRRSIASLSNLFHKNSGEVPTVPEEEEEETDEQQPRIEPNRNNGLPTYGSPRLRPTTSSSSVETEVTSCSKSRRRIQFCPTIQVHETFNSAEYDRRCDMSATCQKMTPLMAMKIKQELNEYKLTDMQIHVDSRKYTHFFL
ncbi:hypothetical protein BJV82DRAFT_605177 [Fennellomyces sp. T-0311]|nr:hypothetical protein BJV82DRAFT_605177 [Fennellomyces sp. T-0311]